MATGIVVTDNLGQEFELGTTVPNKITVKVDGSTIVRDATTGELSAVAMAQDGVVASGSITDVAAGTLTLVDSNATTVDIDLSPIVGVSADAGNLLTLGGDSLPYVDVSSLGPSADAGNLLVAGSDGLSYIDSAGLCAAVNASCLIGNSTDAFGAAIPNLPAF